MPELKECQFLVACDVTNPLCGKNGADAVYGPRKRCGQRYGLQMDRWLSRYGKLAKEQFPDADPKIPGAGAAGGLGFAFLILPNAELKSGQTCFKRNEAGTGY